MNNPIPDILAELDRYEFAGISDAVKQQALRQVIAERDDLKKRIKEVRTLVFEKWDNPAVDEHCQKVYTALTRQDMHCDHPRQSCRDVGCSGADED
jgi:Golgi nucleoside diphosphatase